MGTGDLAGTARRILINCFTFISSLEPAIDCFRFETRGHEKFSLSILKVFIDMQTSPSSLAAAKSVRGHQTTQEKQVIAAVQSAEEGLTREEISIRAKISLQSTCARRNELLRRG